MENRKLLVVDGNNIAYAAYYSYINLSNKGKKVGVLYGLISMIRGYIGEHNPEKIIIVWDSAKDKHRLKLLPDYKGHRAKDQAKKLFDRESFEKQKARAIKIFQNLGIYQIKQEGREADDLIYEVFRKYKKQFNIVLVSADKDFLQLLDNKSLSIWNPIKKVRIHKSNILKHYFVEANKVVDYLCLTGDSSDNIPNYPGCGEKTAIKFLNEFGSISSFLDNKQAVYSKLDRKKLLDLYTINKELIDLKLFYIKHYKGKSKFEFLPRKFNEHKFFEVCGKYAFYSFNNVNYLNPFKRLFYGKAKDL